VFEVFKHISQKSLKEDARKLGENLMTASAAGGFITHVTDITPLGLFCLLWLGLFGGILWIFGLYKAGENNGCNNCIDPNHGSFGLTNRVCGICGSYR